MRFVSGIFLIFCFVVSKYALADPIKIDDLARLTAVQSLSLSRDGKTLVGLIAPPNDSKAWRHSMAVWDANDLSKPPVLVKPDGDVEFLAVRALKAGKIWVFTRKKWTGSLAGCGEGKVTGSTRTYINKIFMTDINDLSHFSEPFKDTRATIGTSNNTKLCTELQITADIAQNLPTDPDHVIISRLSALDFKTEYLRYNLKTGQSEPLYKDRSSETSIGLLDPKTAKILTKSTVDYKDGRYVFKTLIREQSTNKGKISFREHPALRWDSTDRHSVNIVGVNASRDIYYIATDQFSDNTQIYQYNIHSQKYDKTPLFSQDGFDVSHIVQDWSQDNTANIIGYNYRGANNTQVWLHPRLKSVQQLFSKKFPGKTITISDYSFDKTKILVTVSSTAMPPSYYLVSGQKKVTYLGSQRPWLKNISLNETKLVHYTARDGLEIPALLDLPPGWKKGSAPVPAIIHPHGGPWARDFAGWDPSGWIAFFTSRGFAVLRPQYRGSQGIGRKLWLAGDYEWGQKMQDDKDDGASWLVKQGIADPKKIAIMGYSYGGFAAAAAVVRPNSPYQCSIMGAGVSELNRLGSTWSRNRIQRYLQGRTIRGMDPIRNTDKANIPLLVFHGDRDVRVPLYHGKDFYNKVKKKVPAKLVIIKDQPHSLPWTPDMQRKSLKAIESFLHNGCGM